MTPAAGEGARHGADSIPALIVANDGRRLKLAGPWSARLVLCDRVAELLGELERLPVTAVLTETRDADGEPVPAAIRAWVERNPRIPVIIWTAGSRSALREALDLSAAGGDVRLILHPRDDLSTALDRLLAKQSLPHPGAVPALLRGVVLTAPPSIRPELTLGVYHAWPRPSVRAWADSLDLTRQALNRRLGAAQYAAASVVMDHFSAAEVAIRLTLGMRLGEVAAEMGRSDDRSVRRRLRLLGCRPGQLRDEADFRSLIPPIAANLCLAFPSA